jgi:hypothetical protein
MQTFSTLVHLVSGSEKAKEVPQGASHRIFLSTTAALSSLVLSALWGLAAGGLQASNALGNIVLVPMLLLVSGLASLPAVALLWKLTGRESARAFDLVVSYGVALFGGTLVLAVLAPIVALYQHSSAWAGPYVAIASCLVALVMGAALLVRVLGRFTGGALPLHKRLMPVVGLLVLQGAALAQLSSIVPPLYGERTAFGHGIDVFKRVAPVATPSHEAEEP